MGSDMNGADLRRLWNGFWPSRVVLSANNFRIFDLLEEPLPAAEVAARLSLSGRGTEVLLDAATSLGLLEKEEGRYRNSASASRYLVSGKPEYMGDIVRHSDALWRSWSHLDEVVRSGRPFREEQRRDRAEQEAFILGMHNLALPKAAAVIGTIGVEGVRSALDLGGGPGTYAQEMARRGAEVTLFDLPQTVAIARRVPGNEEVSFVEGDFFTDDFGAGYDLILISQILHSFDSETNLALVRRAAAALNPAGRLAIQEFRLAEDHASPVQGALFAINMLVQTDGGRSYSPDELREWLVQAGLEPVAEHFQEDDTVLIIGRKP